MEKDNFGITDKISLETNKGIKSGFGFDVNVKAELFDQFGNLKEKREVHNTGTDAGRYGIIDQILDSPTLPKVGYMELGTGTPAATLLGAYISGSRIAFTTKTRTNNVVTMVCTWGAGVGTGAITEAGLFDNATANTVNMWCSSSWAVVNKGSNDIFKLTWTITQN